ncbi:MAG: hypothetical protein MI741_24240, partial [Rhodospirillales bacterium]|nr:hypothetical protein [Rhodospirillales bacterium]
MKPVSWLKSRGAVAGSHRYISRNRVEDLDRARDRGGDGGDPADLASRLSKDSDLPMWNEEGRELRGEEINAEIRGWELVADHDNLSKKAREADPVTRAEMQPEQRLNKRQALHLIYSLPVQGRDSVNSAEKFKTALDGGLRETLDRMGHRYMYTIHIDHGRMHAHILVKARSESGHAAKPRQLRWDRSTGHAVKQVMTEHARAV